MLEKPLAIACAVLVMLCGFFYVRMNWAITDLAQYKQEVATNTQKAEAAARAKENSMRNQVDRIANNAAQKQTELNTRVSDAVRAAASLRDDIDRLNASEATGTATTATLVGQARTARELLAACTDQYREVAQGADGLRDQVTGLQDYATSVCKP